MSSDLYTHLDFDDFNFTTTFEPFSSPPFDDSSSSLIDNFLRGVSSATPDSPHDHQPLSNPTLSLQSLTLNHQTLFSEPADLFCFTNVPSDYAGPHSYGGGIRDEAEAEFMQRSYSSSCFDDDSNGGNVDSVASQQLCLHANMMSMGSPDDSFFGGQIMRRVHSTGDLQGMGASVHSGASAGGLGTESWVMEEGSVMMSLRAGRYSSEERKERIQKYRAKRTLRNFNKTIKYACRKTLADSRPRVRGRFARNDDVGDTPKATDAPRHDHFSWLEPSRDEEYCGPIKGRASAADYGQTQFHYCGC